MNKKILISVVILAAILIVSLTLTGKREEFSAGKLQITASFYPLAELAEQIGGEKVEVTTLVPAGTEPHDYEPRAKDRVALQNSQIFIFNGSNLEPWVDRILPDLAKITIINASKSVDPASLLPATAEEELGEEQRSDALYDPHFWLDPMLMEQIANNIAKKLSEIDPENSSYYRDNAANYSKKLSDLDNKFRQTLISNCQKKDIVTSHAAFAYLAKRYEFNQIPIAGLSEEEPSPAHLAKISELALEKDIKYIFFETLVNPNLSETIAREVGAKTLVLNPIEGLTSAEENRGEDYISLMEKNLENLKIALECYE